MCGVVLGLKLATSMAAECCLPFGVALDGCDMVMATKCQMLLLLGLFSEIASHAQHLGVLRPLLEMTSQTLTGAGEIWP